MIKSSIQYINHHSYIKIPANQALLPFEAGLVDEYDAVLKELVSGDGKEIETQTLSLV